MRTVGVIRCRNKAGKPQQLATAGLPSTSSLFTSGLPKPQGQGKMVFPLVSLSGIRVLQGNVFADKSYLSKLLLERL
ncbi:MAG TPA: hypothetical protein DD643_07610 [Synechococcus sp. UBA8638]|nr:hypothetical protein [Synechococcus sp. UBA8638]